MFDLQQRVSVFEPRQILLIAKKPRKIDIKKQPSDFQTKRNVNRLPIAR